MKIHISVIMMILVGFTSCAPVSDISLTPQVTLHVSATLTPIPSPTAIYLVPSVPPIAPTPSPTSSNLPIQPLHSPLATSKSISGNPQIVTKPLTTTAIVTRTISEWLEKMTIEEKIGQLMMITIDGKQLSSQTKQLIHTIRPGGIVFLENNISSPKSLSEFTNDLQREITSIKLPNVLIAIDQEGGQVTRLRRSLGYTEFPSPMTIAAAPNGCRQMEAIANIMGKELKAVGINTNLAPVLDVNNNPQNPVIGFRSFSSDPAMVAECAMAEVEGLQRNGIVSVGKHFPGHGDTALDSHYALPTISYPRSRLDQIEFAPFKRAITKQIDAIMSAHIIFPALDAKRPATLSPVVLTQILRQEFAFDGVIFTDALNMGALAASGYTPAQAAIAALQAGADILLFAGDAESHIQAHQALVYAVRNKVISEIRLNESLTRVLRLKLKNGLLHGLQQVDPVTIPQNVGTPESRSVVRSIAQQAITVVRDQAQLLPLSDDRKVLLVENDYAQSSGINIPISISMTRQLVGFNPTQNEINLVLNAAANKTVIFTSVNAHLYPNQTTLIQALLNAKIPVIVVSLGIPYDLLFFKNAPTYIAIYGISTPTIEALGDVLSGRVLAQGRLPVALPGLYEVGHGETSKR